MTDLEDLKKRKERLLLEQEIANLERKQRLGNVAGKWSWKWVAPLGLFGIFALASSLIQLDGGGAFFVPFSLIAICPAILKFFAGRVG